MQSHVKTHVHINTNWNANACIYTGARTRMHTHMQIHAQTDTETRTHERIRAQTHPCTYILSYSNEGVRLCMQTHAHTDTETEAHTHARTSTNTSDTYISLIFSRNVTTSWPLFDRSPLGDNYELSTDPENETHRGMESHDRRSVADHHVNEITHKFSYMTWAMLLL